MPPRKTTPESREASPIRLVAIDLDGTLLNSESRLSQRNLEALGRTHERGVQIALVTGRRYSVARKLTSELVFQHYRITNAGALISSSDDRVLVSNPWERDLLQEFWTFIEGFRGHAFLITDARGSGEVLCENPNRKDPHVARYRAQNAQFMVETDLFRDEMIPNILQVVFMGTIERMQEVRRLLARFQRIDQLSVSQTLYPDRDFELVDVVLRGADKRSSLGQLAEILEIDASHVMAIGDNHADDGMLAFAAYPVVMGNAPRTMRAKWPVTGTNEEDGVAQAIDQFVSGTPAKSH